MVQHIFVCAWRPSAHSLTITGNKKITNKAYNEAYMRTQKKQCVEIPGEPGGLREGGGGSNNTTGMLK